jgi:hypothetical protein
MRATVWVDDWQMQCCGEAFSVGDRVSWRCAPVDGKWLTESLGPELARTVTHHEEHHGGEGTEPLIGTVLSIRAVCRDLAPRPGENPRVLYPVPDTAVLTGVETADGWFKADKGHFAGYLAELI